MGVRDTIAGMPYRTLISPSNLAQLLDDGQAIVVDCRFSLGDPAAGRAEFAASHLPGAVYAHLDEHLSSPITEQSGRHPLPNPQTFAAQLSAWGIDRSVQVVAYDDSGGAFAARFWWLAQWVGLTDVAVLNGGWSGWLAAGHPTCTAIASSVPSSFAPQVDNSMWLATTELLDLLGDDQAVLVDAREPPRYRGDVEPIDPVAGHVPGALNLPFQQNLATTGDFLSADQLRQRFASVTNVAANRPVVHMCGSGVTACVNLLAMEHAGLPNSKLYPGSWSEYLRDPARPVATGNG